MQPNPILKKLGFADDDRVVIVHADDVGMCQATLPAFADLIDFGLVSSGAVMVPCPWFPSVVDMCRQHPQMDLGVHLTLNCEWSTYRWGPVSTRDPASGLMDEEGYLHRTQEAVQQQASPEAVQAELEAQVAKALAGGIDVTHVDTHMGTVAHPTFIPAYVELAREHNLPFLMVRLDEAGWRAAGMDDETAAFAAQFVLGLEEQGVPMLDHLNLGLPLDRDEDRVELAKREFESLLPGLTHFILHPACDTPELRAIGSDWRARVADYKAFASPELLAHVKALGIHVIGYRALRDLMRPRQ
jgi:predicted glycoside hydrolase/deacetylase ChbG (UPF0249 family)